MGISPVSYGKIGSFLASLVLCGALNAQVVPVDEAGNPIAEGLSESERQYTQTELIDLVAPIALYPDDLIGIVLPAASYPLQIVQAARFVEARENDPSLEPDDDWDDAVVALLNYPEVLKQLSEDLDNTWALGEAFVGQQAELLAAVQSFRADVDAAGNLQDDDRRVVYREREVIRIVQADPEVIYVPVYEPSRVVVRYARPYHYHYYPRAYPVYYYPYGARHHFRSGFFWGVSTAFLLDWHSYGLHYHYPVHRSHPYFGRAYYRPHYVRYRNYRNPYTRHRSISVREGYRWQPRREVRVRHRDGVRRQYRRDALATERRAAFQRNQRQVVTTLQGQRANPRTRINRSPNERRTSAGNARVREYTQRRGSGEAARVERTPRQRQAGATATGQNRIGRVAPGQRTGVVDRRARPRSDSGQRNTRNANVGSRRAGATPQARVRRQQPERVERSRSAERTSLQRRQVPRQRQAAPAPRQRRAAPAPRQRQAAPARSSSRQGGQRAERRSSRQRR